MRTKARVTLLWAMILLMAGCTHVRDPLHDWLRIGRSEHYRAPTLAESAALSAAFARGLRGESASVWHELGYESNAFGEDHAVREAISRTRGWGGYVFRTGAARALVVQAPHADSDRRTGEIALLLYRVTGARLLALNSAHRAVDGADQANAVESPFAVLGREAARADVDALVLQVHGYGAATAQRHGLAPSGLVLSNGTHVPDLALWELAACLTDAQFDARLFPTQAPYPGGTRNAVRAAMAGAGAGRFVHVELGEALRADLVQDTARLQAFAACL